MFKTGNAGKKTLSIVTAALLCCCVACSAAEGTKGMDADVANQQNQTGQSNQQGQLNQQDQSSQPDQTTQAGQTSMNTRSGCLLMISAMGILLFPRICDQISRIR